MSGGKWSCAPQGSTGAEGWAGAHFHPGLGHRPCSGTCALTTHCSLPHLLRMGATESLQELPLRRSVCVCVVTSVEPGVCMAVRGCVCMPGCPPVVLHQPLPQSCGDPLVSVPTLSLGLAGGCDELRAADWASLQRWGTGGCFPGSGLRGLQPRPLLGQREAELPVLPACGHKGALGPSFPPFLWSCRDSQQGRHPELFWECGPSSCSCH